jgi:hypothetical protein
MTHRIKTPMGLSPEEIRSILDLWAVPAWKNLNPDAFRQQFLGSELHLLIDESGDIVVVARINHNFRLEIQGRWWPFAELADLVSKVPGKGNATLLLKHLVESMESRDIQTIGYCDPLLRGFFSRAGIPVLINNIEQGLNLLNVYLSPASLGLLRGLSPVEPAAADNK